MKFKPTFDNIIVKRACVTKTMKGVILPDSSVTRKNEGEVVCLGLDCFEDKNTSFAVGDIVAWSQYAGAQLVDPEDDQEYIILKDKDVIAIVKESLPGRCC